DQGNNQQVLDQSLTTLVVVKSLQQSEHSAQVVIVPLQKSKGHWEQGVTLTTMVQKLAASASPGQSSPPARGCPNIVVGDVGAPDFHNADSKRRCRITSSIASKARIRA